MPVTTTTAQLGERLSRALGRPVREWSVAPHPYTSSYALHELGVTFADGESLRLVLKHVGPSGVTPAAALVKTAALRDPWREILTYREVLEPLALGAPAYHGAVVDPHEGIFWLLIEAVDGVPLWQARGHEPWAAAARWLATLHASAPADGHGHLLRYDDAWLARLAGKAAARGELAGLGCRWERVTAWLSTLPQALVHGDFFPSNVLIERGGRPRPVDWELTGRGPLLLDLAALTAGWPEPDRRRIAADYRQALPAQLPLSDAQFAKGLAACRLVVALQWLTAPVRWRPPVEHATDWRAEARAAAWELAL